MTDLILRSLKIALNSSEKQSSEWKRTVFVAKTTGKQWVLVLYNHNYHCLPINQKSLKIVATNYANPHLT